MSTWYAGLDDRQALSVKRAVDELAARGGAAGRPRSAPIHGSRHRNMRELRSVGGNLRILYAFHEGRAVLLAGGDKTGNWKGWYKRNGPSTSSTTCACDDGSARDELAEAQPARSFAALSDELVSLTKVVEALGGYVEMRAVFDDQTITLLREPPAPPAGD